MTINDHDMRYDPPALLQSWHETMTMRTEADTEAITALASLSMHHRVHN